ncbi:MAG: VOC family protein [Actinomycetaceae bacterium]
MTTTGFYPVLMSDDVARAASFYQGVLGFEVTFRTDWYLSLRLRDFELAILDRGHATVPPGFARPVQGLILNLEVDDVDAVHDRLVREHRLVPVQPLRDEDFGQRHVIVEAPDGVLLDIIQPIAPSEEFARAYAPSIIG